MPGVTKFVSSQPQYSALWRKPEAEVIPVCEANGITQIVWSPLAQGVLTGKYLPGEKVPADSRAANRTMNRFIKQWLEGRHARRPSSGCGRSPTRPAITLSQLALAWVLHRPQRDRRDRRRDPPRAGARERRGGGRQALRRHAGRDRRRAQNSGGVVSSGSIAPAAVRRGGRVPQLVEALLGRGPDEPPGDVAQARRRHRPLARDVAAGRDRVVDLDEVRRRP